MQALCVEEAVYLIDVDSRITHQRVVLAGGRGATIPQSFQNRWIFGNFHASLENFWTFAAGKDEGCEFYQKFFEPAPPFTLQVPERLFTHLPKRFL